MSQFWHAHWAEDSFKPARLGNWQVPNWHPKFPCRHCTTTKFLADSSGRRLVNLPRPKRSPWGNFKGTWELPLKIDRKLARTLSAPPKYKIATWEAHKKYRQGPCEKTEAITKEIEKKTKAKQYVAKKPTPSAEKKYTGTKQPLVTSGKTAGKNIKTEVSKRTEKMLSGKKDIKDVDQKEFSKNDEIFAPDQRDDQFDLADNFESFVQEKNIEKLYPQEAKEQKKLDCLCVDEDASQSPVEFAEKAIRKNICTVHQILRV